MNSSKLKVLACFSMLIDHIGLLLLNNSLYFRFIGRLAFPIFAFLIPEGYFYTKNKKKYIARMFVFALISEIPFSYAFTGKLISLDSLNIFFTLFFALIVIYTYDNNKTIGFFMLFFIAGVAQVLRVDYGLFGIFMIFGFHYFRGNRNKQILSFLAVTLLMLARIWYVHGTLIFHESSHYALLKQVCALFAIPLLYSYNGNKGKSIKYLFYAFYPGHLLLIGLIKNLLL